MELKEYIKILQKEKNLLFGSAAVLVLAVTFFSLTKPETFETELSFFVAKNGTQETGDYKYSGYYAIQASGAVAENISQWLKSASVASEIYSRAGINSSSSSLSTLSKSFKADKFSSQYVRINYKTRDQESAKKIAEATENVVGEKLESLEKLSNGEVSFKIISKAPLIIRTADNVLLNIFLAVLGGLFLGIMLALAKNYFSDS